MYAQYYHVIAHIAMAGIKRTLLCLEGLQSMYFHWLEEPHRGNIEDSEIGLRFWRMGDTQVWTIIRAIIRWDLNVWIVSLSFPGVVYYIIKPSMTTKKVYDAIGKLDDGHKYKLFKERYKPDVDFRFLTMGVTGLFSTDSLRNAPGTVGVQSRRVP